MAAGAGRSRPDRGWKSPSEGLASQWRDAVQPLLCHPMLRGCQASYGAGMSIDDYCVMGCRMSLHTYMGVNTRNLAPSY